MNMPEDVVERLIDLACKTESRLTKMEVVLETQAQILAKLSDNTITSDKLLAALRGVSMTFAVAAAIVAGFYLKVPKDYMIWLFIALAMALGVNVWDIIKERILRA